MKLTVRFEERIAYVQDVEVDEAKLRALLEMPDDEEITPEVLAMAGLTEREFNDLGVDLSGEDHARYDNCFDREVTGATVTEEGE